MSTKQRERRRASERERERESSSHSPSLRGAKIHLSIYKKLAVIGLKGPSEEPVVIEARADQPLRQTHPVLALARPLCNLVLRDLQPLSRRNTALCTSTFCSFPLTDNHRLLLIFYFPASRHSESLHFTDCGAKVVVDHCRMSSSSAAGIWVAERASLERNSFITRCASCVFFYTQTWSCPARLI